MTTDKTSSDPNQSPSDKTRTAAKRKLKAGRRTARTSGMSQSAFAGYATPPAPAATESSKTDNDDEPKKKESKDKKR